jgi:hypothetical protein
MAQMLPAEHVVVERSVESSHFGEPLSRNSYDDPHSELSRLLERLWTERGSVGDRYNQPSVSHHDANQVIDRLRSQMVDYEKRYSFADEEDGLIMLKHYFDDRDGPRKIRAFKKFFTLLDEGGDRFFDRDRFWEYLPSIFNREYYPSLERDRMYLQKS